MDNQTESPRKRTFFAEERKQKIMEMLSANQKIAIPELCDYFGVSPATIRNDLNDLQGAGLLRRTHGGAILSRQVSYENVLNRDVEQRPAKQAFAHYALSLISDGDTILLDTGTTTMELARLLSSRHSLTIVTNDIGIAQYLENHCEANIVMLGGYLRRGMHCTVGPLAVQALADLKVDKAFIGTNGLTLDGLSTPDIYQADVKKSMISVANQVIVLADSSKLGNASFQRFAKLKDFDMLITDTGADIRELNKFREMGIEVVALDVE